MSSVNISTAYREAMSRVPHAVHIVTTDGAAGRAGLTATAVTSVSADPPSLLVCLNASNASSEIFRTNGVLTVNTLSGDQTSVASIFGTSISAGIESPTPEQLRIAGEKRFEHGEWIAGICPVLSHAAAVFECKITEIIQVQTHLVVFAAVVKVQVNEVETALTYYKRGYRFL